MFGATETESSQLSAEHLVLHRGIRWTEIVTLVVPSHSSHHKISSIYLTS